MRCVNFVFNAIQQTKTEELCYTNSKKEKIVCIFTNHVKEQFAERFFKLTNVVLEPEQIEPAIFNLFNTATRIGKKNPIYISRNKRHGGNSLYFQSGPMVFIVEDKALVTVEIVTERELN